MKTIDEVLDKYYSDYELFIDDRFGFRLCDFLTIEQANLIGFTFKNPDERKPKEWTEENIIAVLKKDLDFGWEKCCNRRGISADLMSQVVLRWCKVLENGLENIEYGYYGDNIFKTVAERYGLELKKVV